MRGGVGVDDVELATGAAHLQLQDRLRPGPAHERDGEAAAARRTRTCRRRRGSSCRSRPIPTRSPGRRRSRCGTAARRAGRLWSSCMPRISTPWLAITPAAFGRAGRRGREVLPVATLGGVLAAQDVERADPDVERGGPGLLGLPRGPLGLPSGLASQRGGLPLLLQLLLLGPLLRERGLANPRHGVGDARWVRETWGCLRRQRPLRRGPGPWRTSGWSSSVDSRAVTRTAVTKATTSTAPRTPGTRRPPVLFARWACRDTSEP